ncbi:uncharacterized protein F4807DRAFT_467207 [Annulohypoxylon truncatum]|uniref:uncharacterized protein n=1 Tax=Annulohypoxylon truncatum TaxID=327061 RepID=UPI0020080AB7|nr:uncharacterized protein F4807DRAFT_467207 [Annulohypoxylon truncatum]KAI1210507.1 hypothetical protein F4807DRAFT_467207 [Annulohypoxylon truncatum]
MLWYLFLVNFLGVSAVRLRGGLLSQATLANLAPCAKISRLANLGIASNNSATIPASLALDCLRSVPNRPQPAQQLIQSLKAFVNWQATLTWLKDPPASYMLPPVDVQGSLDNISSTVAAGGFTNEYDFQLAIVKTVTAAHDGHFSYVPDVFKAFSFQNDLVADLVSVSSNGTTLPKLYHLSAFQSNNGTAPVAISQINGQNATSFLLDIASQFSNAQDIDAQWNSQFIGYTNLASSANPLAGSVLFIAPSVTLTYEDGKTETQETKAQLNPNVDFSMITSGDAFYDKFCNPDTASNSTGVPAAVSPRSKPSMYKRDTAMIDGYPVPFVEESTMGTTKGFFLNGTGFDDVAVLALSAFEDNDENTYLTNFQNTIETFLSQSRDSGKQRLVIDLTENGGGFIMAGFELFAQLFPGVNPFNANNMRLSESLSNISRILATLPQQDQVSDAQASALLSNLSPTDLFRPQGDKFTSVDELLTPVTLQGDNFTAYIEQPFVAVPNFTMTGTGARANPPPALFKPENIVLLTDGNCGSTCTIFSYLMIFQKDIKTVTAGGRPQSGIMQSIGGTEGSQVLDFPSISQTASQAILAVAGSPQQQQQLLQGSELGLLATGYAIQRALTPSAPGGVNFKNAFAPSDAQTPLQFLYEPANCRFFYTADMVTSAEAAWKYAVDATWTDPGRYCVEGSVVPVNTSKAVDPAFEKLPVAGAAGSTGTNGTGGTNGTDGANGDTSGTSGDDGGSGGANATSGNADDKKNAAEGVFGHYSLQTAGLLAALSIMMLYL